MELLTPVIDLTYIFFAIGLGLMLASFFIKSSKEKMDGKTIRCEGIIFALDHLYTRRDDDSNVPNKITIRFVTLEKKEWITADLNTDGMILWTGQFKVGQKVPVLYNPVNPNDFTIVTRQPPAAVKKWIVFLIGLVFLIVGISKAIG